MEAIDESRASRKARKRQLRDEQCTEHDLLKGSCKNEIRANADSDEVPRCCVIGLGWYSLRVHLPVLSSLEAKGVVNVVSFVSRSDEVHRAGERRLGHSVKRHLSIAAALADNDIDVVDLVLPIPAMPEAIVGALRSRKHIISEKPVAPTVRAGLELMREWRSAAKVVWCCCEQWGHKPSVLRMRQLLDHGALRGCAVGFRFKHEQPVIATDGWRNGLQGGWVADVGVHFMRMLRTLFGAVVSVQSSGADAHPDSVSAMLTFESGLRGSFAVDFRPPASEPTAAEREDGGAHLVVWGPARARLEWNFAKRRIRLRSAGADGDGPVEWEEEVKGDPFIDGGAKAALTECFRSVQRGDRWQGAGGLSPESGLHDLAVIEAAQLSRGAAIDPRLLLGMAPGGGGGGGGSGGKLMMAPGFPLVDESRTRCWTPLLVRRCFSAAEVQDAVRWAQASSHGDTVAGPGEAPQVEAEAGAAEAAARPCAAPAASRWGVRAVGCGHSWSSYGNAQLVINVQAIDHVRVDAAAGLVRCGAGARLSAVVDALAAVGLSLPSLPVLRDQTVGGAVAVGSHGSSLRFGTLSDAVVGMDIVTADGRLCRLSDGLGDGGPRGGGATGAGEADAAEQAAVAWAARAAAAWRASPESAEAWSAGGGRGDHSRSALGPSALGPSALLRMSRVSLGLFGVTTAVTFRCLPSRVVSDRVVFTVPLADLPSAVAASAADHLMAMWCLGQPDAAVCALHTAPVATAPPLATSRGRQGLVAAQPGGVGDRERGPAAAAVKSPLSPTPTMPPQNPFTSTSWFKGEPCFEAPGASPHAAALPKDSAWLSLQYSFPPGALKEVLARLERAAASPLRGRVVELKFLALADDATVLGPNHWAHSAGAVGEVGRVEAFSVCVNAYWAVPRALGMGPIWALEDALRQPLACGRWPKPHWGKLHRPRPSDRRDGDFALEPLVSPGAFRAAMRTADADGLFKPAT